MGGPCKVLKRVPGEDRVGAFAGPPCTDNFQVVSPPFEFRGRRWHSVEQAFQAAKFAEGSAAFGALAHAAPRPDQGGAAFGYHVWQLGQSRGSALLVDWEGTKVLVMCRACAAKLDAHPQLQRQLLEETADHELRGAASTWEWERWNGLVQMLLRQRARTGASLSAAAMASVTMDDIAALGDTLEAARADTAAAGGAAAD